MSNVTKKWTPLIAPAAVFLALTLVLTVFPDSGFWTQHPYLLYMPYILAGLSILLGCFFTQTRVSFLALLLAIVTFLINRAFFEDSEATTGKGETIIFLSTIYIPAVAAIFYHTRERGIFTIHGYVRIAIIISAVLIIVLLPKVPSLRKTVSSSSSMLMGLASDWLALPGISILVLITCIAILLIRNSHESPYLGPLISAAIIFIFNGMNFQSRLWENDQRQTVFMAYMAGGALTLAWAVLESSWRSAHMDELTDLPTRRTLKHHLARLSSTYTIAVLDLDHFKKVNDRYGHETGDQVLKFIASFLQKNKAGKAYRFGGEEFVIVCEKVEYKETVEILDQLRKDIHSRKFGVRGTNRPRNKPDQSKPSRSDIKKISVSVSIGLARHSDKYPTSEEVLEAADKALYRAKKAGRNRLNAAR